MNAFDRARFALRSRRQVRRSARVHRSGTRRRLPFTRVGAIALASAVFPWILGRIVAGMVMYVFAYTIAAVVIASYLLAPRKLRLTGERAGLFPRAMEGDRFEVEVALEASGRVPGFILEERLPNGLGRSVRTLVPRLGRGRQSTLKYSLRCDRRGAYDVGPLVGLTSDPLGLTRRETVIADAFELLVHPRIEVVSDRPLTRQYEDPPIRPPVSKPWPSGLEFYGMREYVQGDDLRRIVWRASARTGRLMVREAEQGITDKITLVLDTDRSKHSDDGDYSESFETGVRAVASLAVRHLREGYEVRCEVNQGTLVRPTRGPRAQLAVLDALARAELEDAALSESLVRLVSDARRDAHIVVATPSLSERDAARLKLLLDTGANVLVIALQYAADDDATVARAAALGCQVASVRPGEDLADALYHEIGAGSR